MNVRIEPARSLEDLDGMLAVERESFTNPWTREMYLAEFEHPEVSHFLVARDEGGRVIGFCSFWVVLDEVHINNLAVLPEHRRSGIGFALLQRILADAHRRGARLVLLEVRRSNDAAQRLYARLGFTCLRVRRDYYSQPVEDALELGREVEQAGLP